MEGLKNGILYLTPLLRCVTGNGRYIENCNFLKFRTILQVSLGHTIDKTYTGPSLWTSSLPMTEILDFSSKSLFITLSQQYFYFFLKTNFSTNFHTISTSCTMDKPSHNPRQPPRSDKNLAKINLRKDVVVTIILGEKVRSILETFS